MAPMAATSVQALPDGERWQYEVKWDGYRALILKGGVSVRIRSRNDKDLTAAYPGVAAAAARLRAETAIVDGEVVAIDMTGRPSFQALVMSEAHIADAAGRIGYGMITGRNLERAMAMAVVDLALAIEPNADAAQRFIETERQHLAELDAARMRRVEATRVEMETF